MVHPRDKPLGKPDPDGGAERRPIGAKGPEAAEPSPLLPGCRRSCLADHRAHLEDEAVTAPPIRRRTRAENTHPSPEVGAGAVSFDRESGTVPLLIERLKAHPRFQELGLTKDPGEALLSVLCSLWRNLSLRHFDILRGLLPADVDLLVAECTLPHGRHKRPETFVMESFLDDITEHLGISRAHRGQCRSVPARRAHPGGRIH